MKETAKKKISDPDGQQPEVFAGGETDSGPSTTSKDQVFLQATATTSSSAVLSEKSGQTIVETRSAQPKSDGHIIPIEIPAVMTDLREADIPKKSYTPPQVTATSTSTTSQVTQLISQQNISIPGAWPTGPIYNTGQGSDSQDGESRTSSDINMDDEEAATTSSRPPAQAHLSTEELLVNAVLVDDDDVPQKPLVNAEMLHDDGTKRRRRFMGGMLVILSTVGILLAVLLSGRSSDSKNSSAIQQTILASSSPTVSQPPSLSPTSFPTLSPSAIPSAAPTRLAWEQIELLQDGAFPTERDPEFVFRGQQLFGTAIHISDISDSPLANRTNKELLVAVEYGGSATYQGATGGLFREATGIAVYLCQNHKSQIINDISNFCDFVHLVEGLFLRHTALSGTTLAMLTTDSYTIVDLGNIDQSIELRLQHSPHSGLVQVLDVNSIGDKLVLVESFQKTLQNFGPPLPRSPLTPIPPLPPDNSSTSAHPPLFLPNLSPTLFLPNGSGVVQRLMTPEELGIFGNEKSLTEVFWTVAMTDEYIVTIHAVEDPHAPTECLVGQVCLFAKSYKVHHTNMLFEDTLPPLLVEDGGVYSTKGIALNDDGTILAVSSSVADYNQSSSVAPDKVEFRVNVFQLVDNSTKWEQKGSSLYSPVPSSGDWFGQSLAMNNDGTIIAIGAHNDNQNGQLSGMVYTYYWEDGGDWSLFGEPLAGPSVSEFGNGGQFGYSVALNPDGDWLMVGAPSSDEDAPNAGQVFVYAIAGV